MTEPETVNGVECLDCDRRFRSFREFETHSCADGGEGEDR